MAEAFKYLVEYATTGTGVEVAYTVPTLARAHIKSMRVSNPTAAAITFDMWVTSDGVQDDSNLVATGVTLQVNESYIDDGWKFIEEKTTPFGSIEIQGSALGLSFQVWGVEFT